MNADVKTLSLQDNRNLLPRIQARKSLLLSEQFTEFALASADDMALSTTRVYMQKYPEVLACSLIVKRVANVVLANAQ